MYEIVNTCLVFMKAMKATQLNYVNRYSQRITLDLDKFLPDHYYTTQSNSHQSDLKYGAQEVYVQRLLRNRKPLIGAFLRAANQGWCLSSKKYA